MPPPHPTSSKYIGISLSVCQYICLSFCLCVCQSVNKCLVLFVFSSICLSVCLSGFAHLCTHFYASGGVAGPKCVKLTLNPVPNLQNYEPVPQVLKQVASLSCFIRLSASFEFRSFGEKKSSARLNKKCWTAL